MKTVLHFALSLLLLLAAGFVGSGCKTPENADNQAERPWNAPRAWETGLPGFMYDRR